MVLTIAAAGVTVMLSACGSGASSNTYTPPVAATQPVAATSAAGNPSSSGGQDAALDSLLPSSWQTSLCGYSDATNDWYSHLPNYEYGCDINLGDTHGTNITGETIIGDQWTGNPGYAGPQSLSDWIKGDQSQSLTIQTVSSITACPTSDNTVACEFPWSNSSYPAASGQLGILVYDTSGLEPTAELLWTIPSQDAQFQIKGWWVSAQYGDLFAQTWFVQNVEGQ